MNSAPRSTEENKRVAFAIPEKKKKKYRSFQKGNILDRMKCVLDVREEWKKFANAETIRNSTHLNFVSYVISVFEMDKACKEYPAVERYLQCYLGTHSIELYRPETIKEIIGNKSESKNYRVVTTIGHQDERENSRLRDFFLWVLQNREKFSIYSLINPFFTYIPSIRHTAPRGTTTVFQTQGATDFERILFVSFLVEIYEKKINPRNQAKKMKIGSDESSGIHSSLKPYELFSVPPISSFKTDKSPQVIGYVLQTITHAWDKFAKHLLHVSIEDMVYAYIYFCIENSRFEVIPSREIGYAPVQSSFLFGLQCTLVPSETIEGVVQYSEKVDTILRKFTCCYLNDLRRIVFSNSTYSEMDHLKISNHLQVFSWNGKQNELPLRFNEFRKEDIETVRESRRNAIKSKPEIEGNIDREDVNKVKVGNLKNSIEVDESIDKNATCSDRGITDNNLNEKNANEVHQQLEKQNYGENIGGVQQNDLQQSRELLGRYIKLYCHMFCCDFRNLMLNVDNYDQQIDILGTTQLVLIDPPFNSTRMTKSKQKSVYQQNILEEMDEVVNTIDELLRPGGHGIIFCEIEMYSEWERCFNSFERKNYTNSIEANPEKGHTFTVDHRPMFFVNQSCSTKAISNRSSLSLQSTVQCAVHVKKNGLPALEEIAMVNYKCFGFVPSSFSAHENIIDNIPKLGKHEALKWLNLNEESKDDCFLVCPSQKPLDLLKELISRFTKAGDLVVDFYAGTFSTAIACLTLPKRRVFVGCEIDVECFNRSLRYVQDRFSLFISDVESSTNIRISDDCTRSALIIRKKVEQETGRFMEDKVPEGFPIYQTFPPHVIVHLSGILQSNILLKQYHTLDLSRWPMFIQDRFNSANAKNILQAEQAAYNVVVLPSLIKNEKAGLGLFAGKTFVKGEKICVMYGTIVYELLSPGKFRSGTYVKWSMMGVNPNRFLRYGLQIDTSGSTFNKIRSTVDGKVCVFIVPPPFCAAGYINDWKYDRMDEDFEKFKDPKKFLHDERTANVSIEQTQKPVSSLKLLSKYDFIYVKALKDINRGDELYADYYRNETYC